MNQNFYIILCLLLSLTVCCQNTLYSQYFDDIPFSDREYYYFNTNSFNKLGSKNLKVATLRFEESKVSCPLYLTELSSQLNKLPHIEYLDLTYADDKYASFDLYSIDFENLKFIKCIVLNSMTNPDLSKALKKVSSIPNLTHLVLSSPFRSKDISIRPLFLESMKGIKTLELFKTMIINELDNKMPNRELENLKIYSLNNKCDSLAIEILNLFSDEKSLTKVWLDVYRKVDGRHFKALSKFKNLEEIHIKTDVGYNDLDCTEWFPPSNKIKNLEINLNFSRGNLDIGNFSHLISLYISSRINWNQESISKLHLLENLVCSFKKKFPSELRNLKSLKSIKIENYDGEELALDNFNSEKLESFSIKCDNVKNIPTEINRLKDLKHLSISGKRLSIFPAISKLHLLESIYINPFNFGYFNPDTVYISDLVKSLQPQNLERIEFSDIKMKDADLKILLDKLSLVKNKKTSLRLNQCGLTSLPNIIWEDINLSKLDLENNHITSLPHNFFQSNVNQVSGIDNYPSLDNLNQMKIFGLSNGSIKKEKFLDHIDLKTITKNDIDNYNNYRDSNLLEKIFKGDSLTADKELNDNLKANYYFLNRNYEKAADIYYQSMNIAKENFLLSNKPFEFSIDGEWVRYLICLSKLKEYDSLKKELLELRSVVLKLVDDSNNQLENCQNNNSLLMENLLLSMFFKNQGLTSLAIEHEELAREEYEPLLFSSDMNFIDLLNLQEVLLALENYSKYNSFYSKIKNRIVIKGDINSLVGYLHSVYKLAIKEASFEEVILEYDMKNKDFSELSWDVTLLELWALINNNYEIQKLNKMVNPRLLNNVIP